MIRLRPSDGLKLAVRLIYRRRLIIRGKNSRNITARTVKQQLIYYGILKGQAKMACKAIF